MKKDFSLFFNTRANNCFAHAGIKSFEDLSKYTEIELLKIRNFGEKALSEVRSTLEKEMPDFKFSQGRCRGWTMEMVEDGMRISCNIILRDKDNEAMSGWIKETEHLVEYFRGKLRY